MKQCIVCLRMLETTGPLRAFSPKQSRCFKCRQEIRRFKRLQKAGKPIPIPIRYIPAYNLIRILYKKYSRTPAPRVPLEVPVRARGHVEEAPKACIIRPVNGNDWIYIASQRGSKQLQYASTGPDMLIYALETLGLEVVIEKGRVIGEAVALGEAKPSGTAAGEHSDG